MSNATSPTAEPTISQPRGLSLRARWTLTFVLGGALPLLALGGATLRIQREGLEHANHLHEHAVLEHATAQIEATLSTVEDATHRVGLILTDGRITSEEVQLQLAQETMANASSLGQVAIYLPNGNYIDAINRREGTALPRAPQTLPTQATAQQNEGRWLPIEYSPQGPLLRYLEPVRREGQLRAFVLGTLRPELLQTRVRELSQNSFGVAETEAALLLLDEQGKILASPASSGALSSGNSLLNQDLLAPLRLAPTRFHEPVSLSSHFDANGTAMVGSLRTLPRHGWAVLARQRASTVFSSYELAKRSLLGAIAGFLALAGVLSTVLVQRTVRPILSLIDLAKAFGKRQFKTRSDVQTGDELELLGGQMVSMADNIERSEAELVRRAQVEANLSRFMPATVAKSIAEGERKLALGGERRVISVLFADVAAFTPFVEGTDPERVVQFLNELFGVMTEVVFRYEGTVDKFIGDSVMAVFGAPSEQADHAEKALSCAEDLHRFVESSADRWKERYGFEPKLAIGVATGEALVGNLGSETRMEYTCVGDTVNIAARLEALARPGQTLVTEEVVSASGGVFDFNPLGTQSIRGKAQPVALYELAR